MFGIKNNIIVECKAKCKQLSQVFMARQEKKSCSSIWPAFPFFISPFVYYFIFKTPYA